jgi:hypothetical protein
VETPTSQSLSLTSDHLHFTLRQVAELFGHLRWVNRLIDYAAPLRAIHDTDEDRLNDWLDACAFMALKALEGDEIRLTDLHPGCFPYFEDVWLKRVKQLKAYFIWKHDPRGSADADYHAASEQIRGRLKTQAQLPLQDFQPIATYFQETYLTPDGKIDGTKPGTSALIHAKARRIWEMRGDCHSDPLQSREINWFCAELYVRLFYENIINAVLKNDEESVIAVLRAFEFQKAPENRFYIINAFEALIAIYFLNKDMVNSVLARPDIYDFSIVPVSNWPSWFNIPAICDGRFLYDEQHKSICYYGRMPLDQKDQLISSAANDGNSAVAIEQLYRQSQLMPYEAMVM